MISTANKINFRAADRHLDTLIEMTLISATKIVNFKETINASLVTELILMTAILGLIVPRFSTMTVIMIAGRNVKALIITEKMIIKDKIEVVVKAVVEVIKEVMIIIISVFRSVFLCMKNLQVNVKVL